MKYVVATIGGIFIFVAVFLLTALVLTATFPSVAKYWVDLGLVKTNNVPGVILGAATAAASFRATLKRYGKKSNQRRKSKGS